MRKMASRRTRYTIKCPRMTQLDSNTEVSGDETLLDATPREKPQWEVLRCGVANS